ncbi:MAG: PorP/SprF family type IX secretion system membrane protein [Bacteroidales bacterium]|jgi:type IX secretion system PorP/SprF family membrane protein|nr:PorP/SprF family type IX secretion system membrane protein [Bacteroidales bacterium]MCK9498334.1 PorP/SprF family type IX secretion system membrane protein [Bacteroidales bacterium]MDY0314508.1 PorP/SprF family type IX secretion system membrane protein [Bacteroidales bacterium]NLB85990.1 PorP/SprF family type IX secretion system membrane protein [Bacteroidales bacterium]
MKLRTFVNIFIFLLIISFKLSSQQIGNHRNYVFNIANQNPAAISIQEIPEIILNHRIQWLGFSGAPKISSIYGKYLFRDDMGASAFLINDKIGLNQKLGLNLGYAYIIRTDNFNISFGLDWSFSQLKLLSTQIRVYEANDQVLNLESDEKIWKPDANAGIMINANNYFVGFSVLQLFKSKYNFFGSTNDIPGLIRDARHFFVTGAYHLNIENSAHSFTPILNMYFTKASPFKFDLIANYSYDNTFSASLGISKSDAIVFSAGYKYDRFTINYAFDFVLSRIRNVSSGAHEITLGVFLFSNKSSEISNPMF